MEKNRVPRSIISKGGKSKKRAKKNKTKKNLQIKMMLLSDAKDKNTT